MFDAYTAQSLWDCFPGELLESVVLASQLASAQGTFASYTLYRVRRKQLSKQEKIANAALGEVMLKLEFWQSSLTNAVPQGNATMPCPNPKVSDRMTDGNGVLFLVEDAEQSFTGPAVNNQALWALTCRQAPGQ